MGLGGIGIGQLLIILLIVVLLFGTRRLKSLGTDLGGAVKGFRKALNAEDSGHGDEPVRPLEADRVQAGHDKSNPKT